MAIYTRFGSEVTILARCGDGNGYHIRYDGDGEETAVPVYELRADGGLAEIEDATSTTADCKHPDSTNR